MTPPNRRPALEPRTPGPSALKDPHLAALLLYLSGNGSDDDGRMAVDFAAILADTREVLTRQPLTNTFDWRLPQRSVAEQVRAAVAGKIDRDHDPDRSGLGTFLLDIVYGGAEETVTVNRDVLQMLVSDHIDAALLRGACIMYCLLKDGTR